MNVLVFLHMLLLTSLLFWYHFGQISHLVSILYINQPLSCYSFSTQQQNPKADRNLWRLNERYFIKGRYCCKLGPTLRLVWERSTTQAPDQAASPQWLTTSRFCCREQTTDHGLLRWRNQWFLWVSYHRLLENSFDSWMRCSRRVAGLLRLNWSCGLVG